MLGVEDLGLEDLEGDVPSHRLLLGLEDVAHAPLGDEAEDAVVAEAFGDGPARMWRAAEVEPAGVAGHGLEPLHHDDGGEGPADVVSQLGVLVGVLRQRRTLAAADAHARTPRPGDRMGCGPPSNYPLGRSWVSRSIPGAARSAEESGHCREDVGEPLEGADVPVAGRGLLEAEDGGRLAVAELLEVPEHQHLAVDRVHGVEDVL